MATMDQRRDRLVTRQVEARGVRDPLVLAAMRSVRRELFVPKDLRREAYDDTPLSIGSGQTISQPYIFAFMIEALALRGGERVLEIGAGSGYAAVVLAEIAGEVFTIERIGQLAEGAAANLAEAGCMSAMRTAPRVGAAKPLSMQSSSRQARLASRNPSCGNSGLEPVWWCLSAAIGGLKG